MNIPAELSPYANPGQSCTQNGTNECDHLPGPRNQQAHETVEVHQDNKHNKHLSTSNRSVRECDSPKCDGQHHTDHLSSRGLCLKKIHQSGGRSNFIWPRVRHRGRQRSSSSSSSSSSSCRSHSFSPESNGKLRCRLRPSNAWRLAVVMFVIDYSLLMLPTYVGAAKGLPDRIPVGESQLNRCIGYSRL